MLELLQQPVELLQEKPVEKPVPGVGYCPKKYIM